MNTITDFQQLFLSNTPLIDVRAPIEFNKGAFPNAVNLPLMTDDERKDVGTCYKNHGQAAAIELGHQRVHGAVKEARIQAWRNFVEAHPNAILYCFRGGLRSRISHQWLAEAGMSIPYVKGGYKALRHYLLTQLHERIKQGHVLILSGATGSGKTELIHEWTRSVDLEGLANHRGSAFGGTGTEQPAQINFENTWSIQWLAQSVQHTSPVLFEDESRLIGRIAIVPEFLELSKNSPIVLLTAPLEERIERIQRDYFKAAYARKLSHGESVALDTLDQFIRQALIRIKKRLGGARFVELNQQLDNALVQLTHQHSWSGFDGIIATLLTDYYDPMYDYQFQKKEPHVVMKGNHQEILQWLSQNG